MRNAPLNNNSTVREDFILPKKPTITATKTACDQWSPLHTKIEKFAVKTGIYNSVGETCGLPRAFTERPYEKKEKPSRRGGVFALSLCHPERSRNPSRARIKGRTRPLGSRTVVLPLFAPPRFRFAPSPSAQVRLALLAQNDTAWRGGTAVVRTHKEKTKSRGANL